MQCVLSGFQKIVIALGKLAGEALGEEMSCPILKADVERRLVCSVIAEPDTVDAEGDVMSAETVRRDGSQFPGSAPASSTTGMTGRRSMLRRSSHGSRERLQCSWGRGSRPNRGWSA
ncbi:MAG: hypothetical protein ACP5OU_00095 [Methanothrix sp.]